MKITYQIGVNNNDEKEFLIRETALYFAQFDKDSNAREYILSKTNFNICVLAKVEVEIIGFYLLTDKTSILDRQVGGTSSEKLGLKFYEDLNQYKNRKGLEGISLLVQNKYRGLGIGKNLIKKSIEIAKENDCDYIFGGQLKTLRNLKHWLKTGRILIAENDVLNITLMDLRSEVLEKIAAAKKMKSQFLDLSHCNLKEIPEEIFELKELKHLVLNYNELKNLPSEIGNLEKLERLSLVGNEIILLPPNITKLQKLKSLNLARNQINFLPPNIGEVQKLEELILAENQITIIPKSIINLQDLIHLDLGFNKLQEVPKAILPLQQLTSIDLSFNQISFISQEDGKRLEKLRELKFEGNSFAKNIDEAIIEEKPKAVIQVILGVQPKNSNLRTDKNNWLNLIADGETEHTFTEVRNYLFTHNSNKLKDDITILSSQFNGMKHQNRLGILSFDEYHLSINKIINNLIKLINEIK